MSTRWLAAIALLVSSSAFADEPTPPPKRPLPVQQPPAVSVTCDWFEIWASHGKGGADPAIPAKVAARLNSSIKQNEYKLLSSGKVTLTAKKAESPKLAKGTASIMLVETVNKSQARLTIEFTAANKLKSTSTQKVSAGDWITPSVNQSNSPTAEAHVLAVGSCN